MTSASAEITGAKNAPRITLGLRRAAIMESAALIAATLAVGVLLGVDDRFASVTPHPFWLIIILIAVSYGTPEALFAALLASFALLVGNIPEQDFLEPLGDWLLRIAALPAGWFLTAIILGEIRSGHIREHDELVTRLEILQGRAERIADAYEECAEARARLEHRVAVQRQTLGTLFDATECIGRPTPDGVLAGAPGFVARTLAPTRFSVFALRNGALEAVACEGWDGASGLSTRFDAASPLFEWIVARGEVLCVCDEAEEGLLDGQGLLAGPLIDLRTGRVFGMLKIEALDDQGLSTATLLDFRTLGAWIGRACGDALGREEPVRAAAGVAVAARSAARFVSREPVPGVGGFAAPLHGPQRSGWSSDALEAARRRLLDRLSADRDGTGRDGAGDLDYQQGEGAGSKEAGHAVN